MPRKPAHLELKGGKGPRQRAWDLIRATLGKPFERLAVTPADVNTETIRTYLSSLEKAGYIAQDGDRAGAFPHYRVRRYVLVRDAGAEAPRVKRDGSPVTAGLAQEQMWRTLRLLKGDTNARELAAHASTPKVPVDEAAAADYLGNLHRADYLLRTQEGKGKGCGGVRARYRLQRNTGPRPPMVCRTKALYDPNLGKVTWSPDVTEEDAIYER